MIHHLKFNSLEFNLQARRFELSDAERPTDFEAWCNGSLKGTKLQPYMRIMEVYCGDHEGRASVGDYVLKLTNKHYIVINEAMLKKYFEVVYDRP